MTRPKFSSFRETRCCLCLKDAGKQSLSQGVSSFWERDLLERGDKGKRTGGNGKGENRNYLQFSVESNRKLKILKFISFLCFLVILRGLTSFFVKIIFRARRIRLSLLIPWKEQRNMLKI